MLLRIVIVSLLLAAQTLASPSLIEQTQFRRPLDGMHDPISITPTVATHTPPRSHLDDPIGAAYIAGYTWYDYQHNGSAGKMIAVDDLGFVHVVWMNGLTPTLSGPRHVFYNVWDPSTRLFRFDTVGVEVDVVNRAGYTCLCCLPSGWCFPAFHEITSDTEPHSAAAMDYQRYLGAFTMTEPPWCWDPWGSTLPYVWPKISVGTDSTIHMVSTESPMSQENPYRIAYSRADPTWDSLGAGIQIEWDVVGGDCGFLLIDTTMVVGANIAASKTSDRVALVWMRAVEWTPGPAARYNWDNDVWMTVSEDGGYNWGPRINVTSFAQPDMICEGGDTLVCDRDTFRVHTDAEVIFDANDNIHLAFTTRTHFALGGYGIRGPFTWEMQSGVWHWSEDRREYTPIFNDYNFYYTAPDSQQLAHTGNWQLNIQRPSLALDPLTGYLFCSLQHYEAEWSDQLYRMGDAYISVSTNNGRTWSVATNVTRTDGGQFAPAGQSLSERDITLADRVTYEDGRGYLHLFYELDYEAGAVVQEEGVATLNPFFYQRVPVDSISLTPTVSPYWPVLHVDSTGYPEAVHEPIGTPLPDDFALSQNWPNPFNSSTQIEFSVKHAAVLSVRVYDVLGREVATLADGRHLPGVYRVSFDGRSLSSGIYFVQLRSESAKLSRKMVLLK